MAEELAAQAEAHVRPQPGAGGGPQRRVLPILVLMATVVVVAGVAHLTYRYRGNPLISLWLLAALAAAVHVVRVAWRRWRGADRPHPLRGVQEVTAALLGLAWAVIPALFFDAAPHELRTLAIAVVFAVAGIAALALARQRAAAIVFCALVAAALAAQSTQLAGPVGVALAAYALLYCAIVLLLLRHDRAAPPVEPGSAGDSAAERPTADRLIAARHAAERANAAKSEFLAVMSHELRTPLNTILGFAELLESPHAENLSEAQRADHLHTIVESSRHLRALVNDLLDIARIERGAIQLSEREADAAEVVEVAVKICRAPAEKADVSIVAHVLEGAEIVGDNVRIQQVLINLVTNAIKFSAPGGFVEVGYEIRPGGGLAFVVRDCGIGISGEDMERIFEPFAQADASTSRRFGGLGLGLAIARRIALLHGGDVTIESQQGVGTTARLVLPAERIRWPSVRAA